jgi:hypothetical protein
MAGLTAGPRPDITPPQIVAMLISGIPILAELLRAFGVYDLGLEQQAALSNVVTWASVLGGALIGGDALLRTGRNLRMGNVESALAAGGEGDKLEIVQKISDPVSTVVPTEGRSDTTTGFEKTP